MLDLDAQTCPADGTRCAAAAASALTEGADGGKERACDSLIMCIVTTLNQGLRNGGGIGDILRAPSSKVNLKILLEIIPFTLSPWCRKLKTDLLPAFAPFFISPHRTE